ncbi:MAG: glutamate racemase [Odoribacteraceae bacterium]|jgi:glutamate racemase|nr:glutamate racemase [Odoribacteraceae bacterium]
METDCPIGVFDSGYGGLTILKDITRELPGYDYIYLGDNARTPYGTRSYDVVYKYTRQAVEKLFEMGCHLVILACNTASAKALRTIQQVDVPRIDPERRVLGVIRPSVEALAGFTRNGHIGIMATRGTVTSRSYLLEIEKLYPGKTLRVTQEACPMWVPLVENDEQDSPGAAFFVQQHVSRVFNEDPGIDTLILACTHYPLLRVQIDRYIPEGVAVIEQGMLIARSLQAYLRRHPGIEWRLSRSGQISYYTTESEEMFDRMGSRFMQAPVRSVRIEL